MTLPSIVPTGFAATSKDFLKVKVDRSGSAFVNRGVVTVPSGTVVSTIIGLIPFQAGMTLVTGATDIFAAALGASVTGSIGVVYDDNVSFTNNQTLFVNGSSVFAAGGVVPIVESATNLPYVTLGNGWVVLTTAGATTTSAGDVNIQALCDYFNGGVQA